MSTAQGIDDPSCFPVDTRVLYNVSTKSGFRVPALVVGTTKRRVIIQFIHWSDGQMVRRSVRPYRLSPRPEWDK